MTRPDSRAAVAAYEDGPVRAFALMAVVWGIVGMLVGVVIAAQLAFPISRMAFPGSATGACARCTPTR